MYEDLRWFGLQWQEGPDRGGPLGPYSQSDRVTIYRAAFEQLRAGDFVYPCTCSRQDVLRALQAPHAGEDEPLYPGTCRPEKSDEGRAASDKENPSSSRTVVQRLSPGIRQPSLLVNWRFRVPDGETIAFTDGRCGIQQYVAGKDFGDFVVWRHDDTPAYQLAVVVDDAAMQIAEVVRGEDLLNSTARQLLLYRALGLRVPAFYHCPLVKDESGARLAKRHDALSLRTLRAQGKSPEELRTAVG
jgi:glutamyl-tRNA synthetase